MWLTVGSKKKKKLALNFLMEIYLGERFFSVEIRFCFSFLLQNPKYVFQDFTPDLQIFKPFSGAHVQYHWLISQLTI